jgi:transposase
MVVHLTGAHVHRGEQIDRAFLKQIDATVERGLSVHVILDNLSAHKAPEVRKWLAHRDRRRWHLHFTPTASSWLNLVERWFKELTDKRLCRGVFTSVAHLTRRSPDGPSTGTPTLNPSSGKPPQTKSSKRSPAAANPSTRSNRRRNTRTYF